MISDVVSSLRDILDIEHRFFVARLYPARYDEAVELLGEYRGRHTFRPNPIGPLRHDGEVNADVLDLRSATRLRPLFKVELREHPKFGTYARAFLGSNILTGLGYNGVWLLKPVDGSWKITTTLSSCTCLGVGTLDGKKHGECKGYGWRFRGFGEEPCRPPGKLFAVERLLEPDEADRPAHYAD